MDPLSALEIRLPPRGTRMRALHSQLRAAILDARLKPGARLPSTRALAARLGVSRNTVVTAYDLLFSEGYLAMRRGAGAYVSEALPRLARAKAGHSATNPHPLLRPHWRKRARATLPPPAGTVGRLDFRVGLPDTGRFPYRIWKRLSARALRGLSRTPASYAEPQGRPALRAAIARHVAFTRAVACVADDVIVTAGAQQAFDLLGRVLVTPGETVVAVEEPGYPPLRAALAASGAVLRGVAVDEEGLQVGRLPGSARIVCVTPSHQFPLGVVLSGERRAALLDFARSQHAVIIEDDYDAEFRFGGRPLDALQTLDRADSVFYVGTFSKSLFPTLRLGFIVAPRWAVSALVAAKQVADWHGPVLAQDTLTAFIAEGHLSRHVRRMRGLYGERRARLLRALAERCAGRLTPLPSDAGLHLCARLDAPLAASDVAAHAVAKDVSICSLERFFAGRPSLNGLAFGYGMIDARRIDQAVERLALAMR